MQKIFLAVGLFLTVLTHAQNTDTVRTDATISNATVYFGYARELTHESKVKITSNTRIIVINQLSTSVDVNSFQISCPEDVALLSHRYSIFYPTVPVIAKAGK
ncbi:MAG: hypothetical protein WDN26_21010 [Chitinophagaceae bacterium]